MTNDDDANGLRDQKHRGNGVFLWRNLGDRFPHSHGTLRPLTFLFCIAGQPFSSRRSARIVFVVLFMNSSTYPAKRHGKRTDTCSLFRVLPFFSSFFFGLLFWASFFLLLFCFSWGGINMTNICGGFTVGVGGSSRAVFIWGPVGSGVEVVPEYLRCLVVFMTSISSWSFTC